MAEFLLPGSHTLASEFLAGSGACGVEALAGGIRWAMQDSVPLASTLLADMLAWGLCDSNGVTNTPKLRVAAVKKNMRIENPATNEATLHFAGRALQAVQGAHLGAVVLEVTNGQVLVDYLSGVGEDATNLHNHFIRLVGYNSGGMSPTLGCSVPAGFFAADGAQLTQNPFVAGARVHRQLNTQLVYYPQSLVTAASPYDAFSVLQQVPDALTTAQSKLARIAGVLSS